MMDAVTESRFQAQVVKLARLSGWLVYHTHDSRRSEPGFPDIVAVRGPQIIFAELKTDKGKLSEAQVKWMDRLGRAADANPGVESFVWRPKDWPAIERCLARR